MILDLVISNILHSFSFLCLTTPYQIYHRMSFYYCDGGLLYVIVKTSYKNDRFSIDRKKRFGLPFQSYVSISYHGERRNGYGSKFISARRWCYLGRENRL